jgi:transcriptional regulatory protein LevR
VSLIPLYLHVSLKLICNVNERLKIDVSKLNVIFFYLIIKEKRTRNLMFDENILLIDHANIDFKAISIEKK